MNIDIAIGVDHRGFALKNVLVRYQAIGLHAITWHDVGTYTQERTDYPIFVDKAIRLLYAQEATRAILACGSGIGMSIAANRYRGIYAALVWNVEVAQKSREDDNSNVLVLPADFITFDQAYTIIDRWLATPFKGERYAERLEYIDKILCS